MNRGEIWWLERPDHGRRPVCILTRQPAIPVLTRVTVVPATRAIRGLSSEVRLGPDDGMPEDCALSFDNIRTVRKALLTERITRLGFDRMPDLCAAMRYAAGC